MTIITGFLLLIIAGGAGAVTRYLITLAVPTRVTRRFPWTTFFINVSGALLLGLATGLAANHLLPQEWRSIIGTGLLGGYTTFSTASLDAWKLLVSGTRIRAAIYALGMFASAVAAAGVGASIGGALGST